MNKYQRRKANTIRKIMKHSGSYTYKDAKKLYRIIHNTSKAIKYHIFSLE